MDPNYGLPWASGLGNGNGPASTGGNSFGNSISSFLNPAMMGNIGEFLGGFLGNHQGNPYSSASNAYNQYAQMGANAMNPFMQGGAGAIPQYQAWMKSMANPTQFTNNLMDNYQESPNAKYLQQQMLRASNNEGSANGMIGSTPMALQNQQNAANISQQDMQNWMGNVLGMNSLYGNSLGNMMGMGEEGGNALLNLYGNEAGAQGEAAYGQSQYKNQNDNNMWGGLLGAVGSLAHLI